MDSRMSKRLVVLCACVSLGILGGCPFAVVFPKALQTTSQNFEIDGGKLKITVAFSGAVDMSSLVAGTNVILVTEKDANASINITSGTTTADIVITSVADYGDLLTFDPDGFFSLKLLGSGTSPIKNTSAESLDGDGNGAAGGDYETTFVLIG